MSKTCQCVTNDDKVSMGLTLVNVKDAQPSSKKNNCLDEEIREREIGVGISCIESGMRHQKLKTPFKLGLQVKL